MGGKIRPNLKNDPSPLDESRINEKAVDLLKENSTAFFTPDQPNSETPSLSQTEQSRIVDMMADKKGINFEPPAPPQKVIDAYDLVTKNSEEIQAKEQADFFEQLGIDMAANEAAIEFNSDPEMGGEGEISFDFD